MISIHLLATTLKVDMTNPSLKSDSLPTLFCKHCTSSQWWCDVICWLSAEPNPVCCHATWSTRPQKTQYLIELVYCRVLLSGSLKKDNPQQKTPQLYRLDFWRTTPHFSETPSKCYTFLTSQVRQPLCKGHSQSGGPIVHCMSWLVWMKIFLNRKWVNWDKAPRESAGNSTPGFWWAGLCSSMLCILLRVGRHVFFHPLALTSGVWLSVHVLRTYLPGARDVRHLSESFPRTWSMNILALAYSYSHENINF